MFRTIVICLLLLLLSLIFIAWRNMYYFSSTTTTKNSDENDATIIMDYGVDVSFPMHHSNFRDDLLLSGRKEFYNNFINGCIKYYGKQGFSCLATEKERIAMSLRQPQSMRNYTKNGFEKIRAPKTLFKMISQFWETNKNQQSLEGWTHGYTYINHWEAPTYMVSVDDKALLQTNSGEIIMKQRIWNETKEIMQEWIGGQELKPTSLYGIRVYKTNSILATHVDRNPLIISAIINVDSDLDEPWPLEVISHDGKAINVTMVPGDMVLYESHSVLHGRPFPLKGRFVANLFIHFEPTGHALCRQEGEDYCRETIHNNKNNELLPPYIIPGTPEEENWKSLNPNGKAPRVLSKPPEGAPAAVKTPIHIAAKKGDFAGVKRHVRKGTHSIDSQDKNGWTPLHEASNGGYIEIVKFLVEQGRANVNMKTHYGLGDTALVLAQEKHGLHHPVVQFLRSHTTTTASGGDDLRQEL